MADSANERQSAFQKSVPTYPLHRQRKSSTDPCTQVIHDKIKSAFSICEEYKGSLTSLVIQFWAPVTIGTRQLLKTAGQPFSFNESRTTLNYYRRRSVEYQYNIDENKLDIELDAMIINGATATAFLTCLPVIVDHFQGNPLECYALEKAGLVSSFLLPICFPSRSNCCIGVVECSISTSWPYDNGIIRNMYIALMHEELSMFLVQERIPFKIILINAIHRCVNGAWQLIRLHKTIDGLKPAKDDIEKALKIVCESHNVLFAQVWIPYEAENYAYFSSSSDESPTKRKLVLKLTGYGADMDSEEFLEAYYHLCDVVPLTMGEEFVQKTLQDYEARFCQDMYKQCNNLLSALDVDGHTELRGLAICLRSIDTGDFDYIFEFVWDHNSNSVIFMEALLLTLKRYLPKFEFASGAKLGDALLLIDTKKSTKTETTFIKIFQGNRLSPIPVSLEEGRKLVVADSLAPSEARFKTAEKVLSFEDIARQFGNTMEVAAKDLSVCTSILKRKCRAVSISEWQGPKVVKKKVNNSCNNHVEISEENNVAIRDSLSDSRNENTLTVKAKFADDTIKFHLRVSEATFVTVEMEIGLKLKLTRGTYKLKYLDEDGELILILSDQDMDACIKHSRNLDLSVVRLHVLLSTRPVSGPTGYNVI